ncbi:MAG: zinc-ribbon domain-containing protein [Minisyncoccia bacterium]
MYCRNCGEKLITDGRFCTQCGSAAAHVAS